MKEKKNWTLEFSHTNHKKRTCPELLYRIEQVELHWVEALDRQSRAPIQSPQSIGHGRGESDAQDDRHRD
jgi:hypothetical protein